MCDKCNSGIQDGEYISDEERALRYERDLYLKAVERFYVYLHNRYGERRWNRFSHSEVSGIVKPMLKWIQAQYGLAVSPVMACLADVFQVSDEEESEE